MQIANKYINKRSLSLTIRDSSQSCSEALSHLVLLLANRPKPKLAGLASWWTGRNSSAVIRSRNYCSHYGVPQILTLEPPYTICSNQTSLGVSSRIWYQQKASVHSRLLQHCFQELRYGRSSGVHQRGSSGEWGTYTQWRALAIRWNFVMCSKMDGTIGH